MIVCLSRCSGDCLFVQCSGDYLIVVIIDNHVDNLWFVQFNSKNILLLFNL